MKKKIDISLVGSNLRGESVFFPIKANEPAPETAGEPIVNKRHDETIQSPIREIQPSPSRSQQGSPEQSTHHLIDKPSNQSVSRLTSQPTSRPISQLANQSTSRSTLQPSSVSDEKTVERPKSFYITIRLDNRLDEAVRYFQEVHGIKKVDRSILVNAMLDTDGQWTNEALDILEEKIMKLLTNKLMR